MDPIIGVGHLPPEIPPYGAATQFDYGLRPSLRMTAGGYRNEGTGGFKSISCFIGGEGQSSLLSFLSRKRGAFFAKKAGNILDLGAEIGYNKMEYN